MHSKALMLLVALMVVTGCGPTAADLSEPVVESPKPVVDRPQERFEFTSYEQVQTLFDKLNYTPEAWLAGIREVPRVYLTDVAPRWRDTVSKEVTVQTKKQIFFRALAPLTLHSNELILDDRQRVLGLSQKLASGAQIDGDDRQWLAALAVRYGVLKDEGEPLDRQALDELIVRVDVVPVSLVLAQCAEESGWGTSRFAAEGNALFGQWSWSGEGIKPEQQRKGMGDYRIAAFETPLASVMAYMMNLNTHTAYAALRARRAQMRANNERISGWKLAETLDKYSERGAAYVDSLHGIMTVNKLDATDDAFLGDGPTILLIPVDKETK